MHGELRSYRKLCSFTSKCGLVGNLCANYRIFDSKDEQCGKSQLTTIIRLINTILHVMVVIGTYIRS